MKESRYPYSIPQTAFTDFYGFLLAIPDGTMATVTEPLNLYPIFEHV